MRFSLAIILAITAVTVSAAPAIPRDLVGCILMRETWFYWLILINYSVAGS